ncbi:hypothetical protein [Cyclobacterium jeungdonense]|uniref:HNH endonuclease n=1 Tax=Cyclobacterium jeungdonense TaxID=708087 RepID=A0ABT8C3Q8_9BACT|nr:hypothetical protein [Cyclobacterium jeungdonense]MDN3687394.1 hypothetical protein [Cyclobacterium jeungdonense]
MDAVEESVKICQTCNNRLQVIEHLTFIELYCSTCSIYEGYKLNEEVGKPCCDNKNIQYTKRLNNGVGHRFLLQCQSCGYTDNQAISRKKFASCEPIFPFNENLYEAFEKTIHEIVRDNWKESYDERKKKEFITWLNENYYPYLESETWSRKVGAVLKRDKYLCQSCLVNNATTAYQITFRHVFSEPLFDLVAVCVGCKEKIINMEIDNTVRSRELKKLSNTNEVI